MLDDDLNVDGLCAAAEVVTARVGSGALRGGDDAVVTDQVGHSSEWRQIDRRMRELARRRAALDAEEARLLVEARRAEVHVHLGYGSFVEYLQRVCGYAPQTAWERMRVAEALESLPATRGALAAGEVTFSAVRELTRVANADTEDDWLVAIAGCTAREVEDAVRGHAPGACPDDRPDPSLETRALKLQLTPDAYALFRQARCALARETGDDLTDSDFVAMICRRALAACGATSADGPAHGHAPLDEPLALDRDDRFDTSDHDDGPDAPDDLVNRDRGSDSATWGEARPRCQPNMPPFQIAMTQCRDCKRVWQEIGRASVELPQHALERARCDARELGDVDGVAPSLTARTIPAPIRRAVLARDRHRCTIPGCLASDHVDVHHLIPRALGGSHTMSNLTTLCDRHHTATHDGRIMISGMPGDLRVMHADGRPYGAAPPDSPRGEWLSDATLTLHVESGSAADELHTEAPSTPSANPSRADSEAAAARAAKPRSAAAHQQRAHSWASRPRALCRLRPAEPLPLAFPAPPSGSRPSAAHAQRP